MGGKYTDTLKHPGFKPFLWTQFLGALNDNIYKIVVSLVAVDAGLNGSAVSGHLSLVGAIFILPFFLFSGYAGHLADVFSKRTVLVVTKVFEIVVMALGIFALLSQRLDFMLAILFLMALQSTFFSPAKYGIVPEMLPDRDLSRANGLLEMSTFLAIILGTSVGSALLFLWGGRLEWIGIILTAIAAAGTLASLGIPRVPPSGAQKPLSLNPWAEIGSGIKRLRRDRVLWLTVIGISHFWFLGALLQMGMILYGKELMALEDIWIGILGAFLAIGIGLGSVLAGRLSGDKVELGLVPLGSIGIAIFSVVLSSLSRSYIQVAAALLLLGLSGGLFIVPLNALLQQRSGREEKGQLIATNNFLNTVGVLLASGVLWLLRDLLGLLPDRILLALGLFTFGATAYVLAILPEASIRFSLWMLTHTIYKIRIVGQEHVPSRGPALLISNHISYVDALLIAACVQRFVRFMMYRPHFETWVLNWLFRLMKVIPVSSRSRRDIVEGIQRAREELSQGHVVCIFAEGAVSRTGNLLPFKRGAERIVEGMDVPVVPVYLDNLWGSIFSFREGRFFWKWPRRIPYPVTVSFGQPLPATITAHEARQAIMELGSDVASERMGSAGSLPRRFIKSARRNWFAFCMADSSGNELSYGRTLVAALLLARRLRKNSPGESMVGIMLPASVPGALANIAALLSGKIPVNLNFTSGRQAIASATDQCGIRTIVTSRAFLAKAKLDAPAAAVFIEEIIKEITPLRRFLTALYAALLPARLIELLCAGSRHRPDSLATIIFSSGSTGTPKGVMLSHRNITSNIDAIAQIFWVTKKDRIAGVLPFFHAFGLTGTLWFPLLCGLGVVYHPSPMDAAAIGDLVSKHKATILISTPTFYGAYLRRCTREEFSSLRYAIAGGEKLRESTARAFKEKYGIDLLEGYGCTEMAPVVSVNIPDFQDGDMRQTGFKPGTVGHPIPGVAVKVVDPETWKTLAPGEQGLLLVKGPNRMIGYLGQPEKTREVFRDGWYVTGDIASVDEDGFIHITDRLSRFSKIAGEMVPHVKVEEAIRQILGDDACVVLGIPDEQKGERLVALYAHNRITAEELWEKLNQTDLPKLWIPKPENLLRVEAIPLLATGKVDLKGARAIALEKTATLLRA